MGAVREQCQGMKTDGSRCSFRAKNNGLCGKHDPNSKIQAPPIDNGFRFEFMSMAREIKAELDVGDIVPTCRPQYWTLIINCVKNAKEEQRLLDGIGVGATYTMVVTTPPGKPELPTGPPLRVIDIGDEGKN